MSKLVPISVLAILLFSLSPQTSAQPFNQTTKDAIDNLMREALKSWRVPGATLGIVKDGKVVFLKGFGVRELHKADPVTPDTVFPIASCTKSFTTLAMAMLIDEGKMAWDDPVRKHVEFFHLSDPLADSQVTLRDLVTHRTGVADNHLLWYRAPWSLEERIRKVGRLELSKSFRSAFQYQTILFGTAGLAVGKASGTGWQDFIRKRILTPLDMKSTTVTTAAAKAQEHASPHKKNQHGKVEVISWYQIKEPDPAGSINSNARDLIKFIHFQLGDGTWKSKRLVSARNLAETHTPQIVVRREGFARIMNPDTFLLTYAMGWVVQDYRGQLILLHGGAIDGFRAHFTLVPAARLGIVLLNNLHNTQMNIAVSNTLVDLILDLPAKDWNAYYLKIQAEDEALQRTAPQAFLAKKHKGTKPSRPLEAYTGVYEDPAYGQMHITLEKGNLVWQWSSFKLPLEHFHYDTFITNNEVFTNSPFVFSLDYAGDVTALRALKRSFRKRK
jgi:CubicO group peptidase (beta-lactamase class C family)